jgi:hypothetical protein
LPLFHDNLDQNAEQQFAAAKEQNFIGWLQSLVAIFVADGADPRARQLGGLMIKNSFFAKSDEMIQSNQKRWQQLDAASRDSIKTLFCRLCEIPNESSVTRPPKRQQK